MYLSKRAKSLFRLNNYVADGCCDAFVITGNNEHTQAVFLARPLIDICSFCFSQLVWLNLFLFIQESSPLNLVGHALKKKRQV